MSNTIHVIAPCPPPITGMTIATQAVVDSLGSGVRIYTFSRTENLSPWKWSILRQLKIFILTIKAALRSRGRDNIYLVPSSSNAGLFFDLIRALLLRFAFKRIWLHHHVSSYCNETNVLLQLTLWVLSPKARHVVLDATMAAKLEAHYGAEYFFTLNNASLIAAPPSMPAAAKEHLTIGFIGNLTRQKGLIDALSLMETASTLSDRFRFTIAGPLVDPALSKHLTKFVSQAPLHRQYNGAISGAEKQAFFNDVDVLLFPTQYKNEAQPLTIYEGMSYGCAVLATNLGGIGEQLAGLGTCFEPEHYLEQCVELVRAWGDEPQKLEAAQRAAWHQFSKHKRMADRQLSRLGDVLCS